MRQNGFRKESHIPPLNPGVCHILPRDLYSVGCLGLLWGLRALETIGPQEPKLSPSPKHLVIQEV